MEALSVMLGGLRGPGCCHPTSGPSCHWVSDNPHCHLWFCSLQLCGSINPCVHGLGAPSGYGCSDIGVLGHLGCWVGATWDGQQWRPCSLRGYIATKNNHI